MREKHRFQRGGRVIDQMCGLCSAIADAEIHQMGDIERAQSKTVTATPSTETQQCSIVSEPVLARDWNTPEEDEAWKGLQVRGMSDAEIDGINARIREEINGSKA